MYPTTVIVIVETQRSMTDIFEITPLNASSLAGLMASDHELGTATLEANQ